jgi:beta-glucosidase
MHKTEYTYIIKRRLICSIFLLLFLCHPMSAQTVKMRNYINDLMSRMTLEEKFGQLNLPASVDIINSSAAGDSFHKKIAEGKIGGILNYSPSLSNIRKMQEVAVRESPNHIPLIFGLDVIHGYRTIFPIPLDVSCTWDMAMIEKSARLAAIEASADGINWTYSPMVDIARDARWGRIAEGAGEDAWLGSQIAKAMVKGYQGDNLAKKDTIMACIKHFALYGAGEAGREYNTADMSRITMYQDYLVL